MNTFEKQAPMWTLGVGGRPLLIGLGGVCLFLSLLLGGTGGVSDNKSGLMPSPSPLSGISPSPTNDNYFNKDKEHHFQEFSKKQ